MANTNGEAFNGFPKQTLTFLKSLRRHNTRDWFDEHRDQYERYYVEPARAFVSAIQARLPAISKELTAEPRIDGSIRRIHRDMRFLQDGDNPYKEHMDLFFDEGGSRLFVRIQPGSLDIGAGRWTFLRDQLVRYRKTIAQPKAAPKLARLLARARADGFDTAPPTYKRVPKGLPAETKHEALFRMSGVYAVQSVDPPPALHTPRFVDYCIRRWKKVAALHRWVAAM